MSGKYLTHARLRELLTYDPDTGVFRWNIDRGPCKAGDVAGSPRLNGYRTLFIDGRFYLAHRAAWLYMKGCWPESQIDHRNNVRSDNHFDNLREATNQTNNHNKTRPYSNSKTGLLGVTPLRGKYHAQISINGKNTSLGLFSTPGAAQEAYLNAKRLRDDSQVIPR